MTSHAPAHETLGNLPGAGEPLTHHQRIRAIVAGSAGNLIEWYDFYAYAFMALYFASSFFPAGDQTAQLLNVAGIYAAGFLIRPLGGWFFGRYSDRHGRKRGMVASVLLMGVGSLIIGLLPTHSQIGYLAPALLLLARLIQGFSTGGQYGAAATYLSEVATAERRGFYASFQFVTLIGGQLCALLVLIALQWLLSEAQIRDWAWRIPFLLGAVLAATVLLFRDEMHETVTASPPGDAGSLKTLAQHPKEMGVVIALTAGGAVCIYAFTTYMQKFLVNTAGLDIRTVSNVMLAAMILFMLLQPLIGSLSDRIGRRRCLLIFASLMTVGAVPMLSALSRAPNGWSAFLLVAMALVILSFYTSVSGLFKAELFPPHIRALGVGLAHSLSAAVFGGTAEYIGLAFKQVGFEAGFYWYVALVCLVAFLTALFMREPKRADMMK